MSPCYSVYQFVGSLSLVSVVIFIAALLKE